MKIGPEFRANPAHRYVLPPGVVVHSAKFGRTQVDIWRDAEPSAIYRGTPAVEVGRASLPLYTYSVHGRMSGSATSLKAAKAYGEARALEHTARRSYRYALTAKQEKAEREAFAAYLADIDSRFPA